MIRRLLALLIVAPIAACAVAPTSPMVCRAERGIGGTGAPAIADRGIGGTGIGGTGIQRTGVVGTVTGFGSICVNGLKLTYDPATPVETATGPIETAALRIGHVVAALTGTGPATNTAEQLTLIHAVRGPIETLSPGRAQIAGQTVATTDLAGGADLLRVGQWVAVSGLRRGDGIIIASRLEPAVPGEAAIIGLVETTPGGPAIGAARLVEASVRPGETAAVSGPYANSTLRVTGARAESNRPFGFAVSHMVVAAYLSSDGDRVRLGQGTAIRRAPGLPRISENQPAVVDIIEEGGELVAIDLHEAPRLEANSAATPPGTATPATTATAVTRGATSATKATSAPSSDDHASGTTTGSSSGGSSGTSGSGSGNSGGTGSSSGSSGSGGSSSGGSSSGGSSSGGSSSGGSSSGGSSSGSSGSSGSNSGSSGSGSSSGGSGSSGSKDSGSKDSGDRSGGSTSGTSGRDS
jgi:hypothetical protein